MILHRAAALFLMFLVWGTFTAVAQNSASPAVAPSQQVLKPEEIDALVAGIALYPDTLLSLVLMASTYPLEVVQADRWVKKTRISKATN